ncbi:MAG: hypothetical protein NC200_01740 [Candidatus Gastranaerophilales bacterium]|nr:hypothetical protein [Candidatus Gastranaerophilales bacterium]
MKKIIAIYLVMFMASNCVFAGEWTKMKEFSAANKQLEVWYNPTYTKCDENYVLYTMRFKEKGVGDYINIVCTDTTTMDTAVIGTYLYDKKFVPEYPEIYSFSDCFKPLDTTSMLYPVAQRACADYKIRSQYNNSGTSKKYSKRKTSYVSGATKEKKSFISSFFGGLFTVIGVIIVLPFVIVGKILSAG